MAKNPPSLKSTPGIFGGEMKSKANSESLRRTTRAIALGDCLQFGNEILVNVWNGAIVRKGWRKWKFGSALIGKLMGFLALVSVLPR
ncbi:uncharacterized protein RSE6_05388 [Rhynchosporium secalis]|uniref:Uncharacterized protein n=1 Tax=Rhynchosporium secalis TaxID=38038 RepID=A0A1E1M7M6_RHYSE|nr:uncharacterized protein RSE6_05388 [Rhynchosporium secalis]